MRARSRLRGRRRAAGCRAPRRTASTSSRRSAGRCGRGSASTSGGGANSHMIGAIFMKFGRAPATTTIFTGSLTWPERGRGGSRIFVEAGRPSSRPDRFADVPPRARVCQGLSTCWMNSSCSRRDSALCRGLDLGDRASRPPADPRPGTRDLERVGVERQLVDRGTGSGPRRSPCSRRAGLVRLAAEQVDVGQFAQGRHVGGRPCPATTSDPSEKCLATSRHAARHRPSRRSGRRNR